jgi:hypothetical protein
VVNGVIWLKLVYWCELSLLSFGLASLFYFPHIEYGKLISSSQKWIFVFADFYFLSLIIAIKHNFGDTFFSVCHVPPSPLLDEICLDTSSVVIETRKLKFSGKLTFGLTWCTSHANYVLDQKQGKIWSYEIEFFEQQTSFVSTQKTSYPKILKFQICSLKLKKNFWKKSGIFLSLTK